MAFLPENGTGLANANSYATVQEFKDYLGDRGRDLSALTDTQIEQVLVRGTFALDGTYGKRWRGDRSSYTQGLDWPRTDAKYPDDTDITGVPPVVKNAAIEFAWRENTSTVVPDKRTDTTIKKQTNKVDVIEQTIEYHTVGQQEQEDAYPAVTALLCAVLRGSFGGDPNSLIGTPRAGGLDRQPVCDRVRDHDKYPISFYNGQFNNEYSYYNDDDGYGNDGCGC